MAAGAGVSKLPASSADKEALAAYLKVQNGSDVRGVAIDTKPSGKVVRWFLLACCSHVSRHSGKQGCTGPPSRDAGDRQAQPAAIL